MQLLRDVGLEVAAEGGSGHFGYSQGARIHAMLDDGGKHHLGLLDWGGQRMQGRARLDLSGSACARISDWQTIQDWISRQWEPTITRVDLAVDCIEGEFTVDNARDWLAAGEFTAGEGRPPRHSTPGDWLAETPFYGRTLEIGRRENGKMLRAYEKGLQLSPGSGDKWTRFEVELRNKDRDIPLDVLTRCDTYFAGAYECLARVLPVAGERIKTHQKEGELTIQRLTHYCSEAYGKLLTVFRGRLDIDEVLDVIARPGVPRRLEKSSLAGFLIAEAPAALLKENRK
jgi:phage replication initiation protein